MGLFIRLLLCFSAVYANPIWAKCINVPKSTSQTTVKVCESSDSYTFHIAGNVYDYNKGHYQEAFGLLLQDWYERKNIDPTITGQTRVIFWAAVPEANPGAVQARAVMQSGGLRFVFFLPIHPSDWSLANIRVSILGQNEAYPEFYGHSAGSLLVKRSVNVNDIELNNFMATYGAESPEYYTPGWVSYSVPVFKEQSIKQSISRDDSSQLYVERSELNHIFEWIALRERVFAFSIRRP